MPAKIRKLIVQVDETRIEMGQADRAAHAPRAGHGGDRQPVRRPLRREPRRADRHRRGARRHCSAQKCVQALGIAPGQAQSYGKAAIVGEAGELEHAAAILHPKLGAPLRKAVEKGAALVPSAKKRGGLGTAIDVPLGHKDAAFVRSHFDAMEARVSDAPRANEIVVAVVVTDSGRPLPRIGGLQVHEIKGEDGLR